MKKRTKISLVLSSAAAILLAGSIMAGGTYALFTSESKTNIAVNSGTVDVTATISDLKTYSGEANSLTGDPTADAGHIVETATKGTFTNGGTANINTTTGDLELFNVTPGDKVTFNIKVKNNSTVAAKYRTLIKEESDGGLFGGLTFKINEFSTAGRTRWAELAYGSEDKVLPCEVSLPSDAGNEYQNKKATISFTVEAVQGNAQTYVYPAGVTKADFGDNYVAYTTAADDTTVKYAADLKGAVEANATAIYVREDAVFTYSYQHLSVKNSLVVYGNDADFLGTDLAINYDSYGGTKFKPVETDLSLTINDAINLRAWGYAPKQNYTHTVTLNNCSYYGTGRTSNGVGLAWFNDEEPMGTLNIALNDCYTSDVGEGMKIVCAGTVKINNSTFNRCGVGVKAVHKETSGTITVNVKDTTFNSCGCLQSEATSSASWLPKDSSAIKCKTKSSDGIKLNLTNVAVNNKIGEYAFHIDDDEHDNKYTGTTTVVAENVKVDGEAYTFNA